MMYLGPCETSIMEQFLQWNLFLSSTTELEEREIVARLITYGLWVCSFYRKC